MAAVRFCFRADDIGSSRSANEAGVLLAKSGIARNVSVMVPSAPYFEQAAEFLKGQKQLCLGLHVTLNCEWVNTKWRPVLDPKRVPTLVDNEGHLFKSTNELHERNMDVQQAVAEVTAQLRKCREHGLEIRYMDQHMGVGWVNGLSKELAALCKHEGIIDFHALSGLQRVKHEGGTGTPLVRSILNAEPLPEKQAYLVVLHPSCNSENFKQYVLPGGKPGLVAEERAQDLRVYTDPEIRTAIGDGRLHSLRFDQLAAGE